MSGMTVTMRLTGLAHPWFAEAAELFDEYRQHFGANPAPEVVGDWLRDQVIADRSRVYVAGDEMHAYGLCSVAVVPAALTLRTAWLIRDLYVAPTARRHGVAHQLIDQVAADGRAAGAHRLSLQTDAANTRLVGLFSRCGFTLLTDVDLMDRVL